MSASGSKLRLGRVLGVGTWIGMALFGLIRIAGRWLPWNRWMETNEFLDGLLPRGGTLRRSGARVVVEQHCPRLGHRLRAELRPGTSDLPTWTQVATLEDYADVVDALRQEPNGRPVRTVLDAGANIGLVSLYFAVAFPEARILAVEPDPSNFELLSVNAGAHGKRIACARAAFWPVDEPLRMDPTPFRGGREWSRGVTRVDGTSAEQASAVPVLTPAAAAHRLGGTGIDLLKLDIEGSEAEFFANAERTRELLRGVHVIAVEVHPEKVRPVGVVLALDRAGYLVLPGREMLIGVRRG